MSNKQHVEQIEYPESLAADDIKRYKLAGNNISYICHNPEVPDELLSHINEFFSDEAVAYSEHINLYTSNTIITSVIESIEEDFTPSEMCSMGFDQEDLDKLRNIARAFQYIDIEGC